MELVLRYEAGSLMGFSASREYLPAIKRPL
jgi:hypothetical protein